jgi:hypothetical protein
MLETQKEVHEDITERLPEDVVTQWRADPIEAVQGPDGNWTSPLMDPVFDGKHLHDLVQWQ